MGHKPTPEQEAIIDAAVNTKENLMVSALAGAAKTSTLVMIAEALPNTKILSLAFNKKIATEMTERLPKNCTAMTLNSLGHRTWASALGQRLVLDTSKNYTNLKGLIDKLSPRLKDEAYEYLSDMLQALDHAKNLGWIPDGHYTQAKRLCDNMEFFGSLDEEPTELMEELLINATVMSLEQAWKGKVDFGDQLLMPTVFPAMFDHYPLVLGDEIQDFSPLNHAMVRKLAKTRFIGVGDSNQSIYAFRGAHHESMEIMRKMFNMRELILSVSFRCPKRVVEEARWRAPHMQYPEWAIDGEVQHLAKWDEDTVPQTAAIICRNNAPLFSMAIRLLKNGRYPQIIGNDIGKGLMKIMRKFGNEAMSRDEVMGSIDLWEAQKLAKTRAVGKVHDQASCMRVFANHGENLGQAIAYAEHLFASQGPIQMMTGHKSKGLEFDTVFFLDQDLLRLEDGGEQEKNLKYVIQTRAKKQLFYVSSDAFDDAE